MFSHNALVCKILFVLVVHIMVCLDHSLLLSYVSSSNNILLYFDILIDFFIIVDLHSLTIHYFHSYIFQVGFLIDNVVAH